MKRLIILSAIALLGWPLSYAQAAEEPATGESCNYDDFKEALGFSEGGGQYTTVNTIGYIGKYQFGEAALNSIGWYTDSSYACGDCNQDFTGSFTGDALNYCGGVRTKQDFLSCPEAQEAAFQDWVVHLTQSTEQCQGFIGQPAPAGGCDVTLSGIVGAAHLGGPGGICQHLRSGGSYNPCDRYGTCISDYLCKFADYEIPDASEAGECSAPTSDGTGGSWRLTPTGYNEDPDRRHFEEVAENLKYVWVAGLMLMTEQLSVMMMDQVQAIGMLLDAKFQLDTQRLFQQKTAQAHKDYHPSEQMCEIGTMVRDLASTETHARLTKATMAQHAIGRELSTGDRSSTEGPQSDLMGRMIDFRETYCTVADNANGLDLLCHDGSGPDSLQDRDVDFTRTLDSPLTLDIDLLNPDVTDEEKAVFSLMNYLFLHRPLPVIPERLSTLRSFMIPYQNMRSLAAMRGVARNSLASIIAQKAAGPEHEASSGPYLMALMRELGIPEEEVTQYLGERPSYFAQMEVLTKKAYQNPVFVANLYDKPVNVERIRAAMRAIKLMQDRDIHASLTRREMLLSMILELQLRRKQQEVFRNINNMLFQPPPAVGTGATPAP